MSKEPTEFPQLLRGAIASIVATPFVVLVAVLLPLEAKQQTGLLVLAASMLCFGIGEVINHPLQTGYNLTDDEWPECSRFHHRHRNSCSLGNLLLIAAVLLFFVSLGKFISF